MQTEFTVTDGGHSYTLRVISPMPFGTEDWPIWFENEAGEGMSMSEKNLFDVLDAAFKEQF